MKTNIKRIIAATQNEGKLSEIKYILRDFGWDILSMKDAGFNKNGGLKIEETGFSFYENALIKAKAVWDAANIPVLADDSGLCVEFLDGMPGIFSSRFSGSGATDTKNNKKLLRLMKEVPMQKRRAYFRCVMVFMYGRGKTISASGRVNGYIADSAAGTNGFGYDPVFYLPGRGMTMAQLAPEKKNRISHRYRAFLELKRKINTLKTL